MSQQNQKVALVTGSSSGIGLAIANRLATEGYIVFGTSRRPQNEAPDFGTFLQLDVTDDASIASAIAQILALHGRIDVLVNNAGVGLTGAAEESSRAQGATLFDTNLLGMAQVTNAVLPTMRAQGSGRIVNISSIFGFAPAPNLALYAASKYAVEGYSESLDQEIRHFGIRVSIVEPGITASNFDANIVSADSPLPAYDSARTTAAAVYEANRKTADRPEVVVDAVIAAINAPKPKVRYPAGKVTRQLAVARRFAPLGVFDRVIRSANKLPAGKF